MSCRLLTRTRPWTLTSRCIPATWSLHCHLQGLRHQSSVRPLTLISDPLAPPSTPESSSLRLSTHGSTAPSPTSETMETVRCQSAGWQTLHQRAAAPQDWTRRFLQLSVKAPSPSLTSAASVQPLLRPIHPNTLFKATLTQSCRSHRTSSPKPSLMFLWISPTVLLSRTLTSTLPFSLLISFDLIVLSDYHQKLILHFIFYGCLWLSALLIVSSIFKWIINISDKLTHSVFWLYHLRKRTN